MGGRAAARVSVAHNPCGRCRVFVNANLVNPRPSTLRKLAQFIKGSWAEVVGRSKEEGTGNYQPNGSKLEASSSRCKLRQAHHADVHGIKSDMLCVLVAAQHTTWHH